MTETTLISASNNDVVLKLTRVLAVIVIPILAAAFIILYLNPDTTAENFSWPIKPYMSSMMLGATYFTGVIYFSVVLRARHWHQIRLGLLPVALFASILGVTTILHWEKFSHHLFAFWLWTFLYWSLPFVIIWAWVRNERVAKPLSQIPGEVLLSNWARSILALLGGGLALSSLLLFFLPTTIAEYWPWKISALTGRILSAEFALFAFFMIEVAVVAKWSQVRKLLLPQLISPLIFVVMIWVSWQDFDQNNPLTWAFVAFVVLVFVIGFPGMYFPLEAHYRRNIDTT